MSVLSWLKLMSLNLHLSFPCFNEKRASLFFRKTFHAIQSISPTTKDL